MKEHQNLPNTNQLSVLVAAILLSYALAPFVTISTLKDWTFHFTGAIFLINLDFSMIVSLLVAGMAAMGMLWLLQSHPRRHGQNLLQHTLLPAFTAWVIGIPLNTIQVDLQWWVIFAFGGALLVMVLIAEYIVVDLSDMRHALAAMGLTAVSFALYLFLAISIHGAGSRLYLLFPALGIAMMLVVLRTLYLRLSGRWCVLWSVGIAFVIGQFAVGLHYWPLSSLTFGLILLGPAYAITSVAGAREEGRSWDSLWVEPVLMMGVFWGLAIFFGG